MKNDLTSEEWKVLDEYLRFGEFCFGIWDSDGVFENNYKLLVSAKLKVAEVAKNL